LDRQFVICPGITIGKGCVIGAGSVVTKDIPDNSLAGGESTGNRQLKKHINFLRWLLRRYNFKILSTNQNQN
jgi:bifunctional N-acetylglucosamine-1-phosphate-uridyltransferase/glucosamine-1-phosphate-acetyltransferase GlmU-like protein